MVWRSGRERLSLEARRHSRGKIVEEEDRKEAAAHQPDSLSAHCHSHRVEVLRGGMSAISRLCS